MLIQTLQCQPVIDPQSGPHLILQMRASQRSPSLWYMITLGLEARLSEFRTHVHLYSVLTNLMR